MRRATDLRSQALAVWVQRLQLDDPQWDAIELANSSLKTRQDSIR